MDIVDQDNKINIEYDGEFFHKNRKKKDKERDRILKSNGWKVLRISSNELNSSNYKTEFKKIINKCKMLF